MTTDQSGVPLIVRRARRGDLPTIVAMLADDLVGASREDPRDPLPRSYLAAFEEISRDPDSELVVASVAMQVVGTLQVTYTRYLTDQGGLRATVEGVRVKDGWRSEGVGHRLMAWAIGRARSHGCHLMQLTSDKARNNAVRFYADLGFEASHEGLTLRL